MRKKPLQFLALERAVMGITFGNKRVEGCNPNTRFRILPIKVMILDDRSLPTLAKLLTVFRH